MNRLKYTENLFYDLFKIAKHEGFATFWAGGYCFYAKNLLYAMCTVYMCDYWIDKNSKWEKKIIIIFWNNLHSSNCA